MASDNNKSKNVKQSSSSTKPPQQQNKKKYVKPPSILGAITRALFFWIVTYFLAVQILVFKSWDRIHPTITKIVIENVTVPYEEGEPEVITKTENVEVKVEIPTEVRQKSEHLQSELQRIQDSRLKSIKHVTEAFTTLKTKMNSETVEYPNIADDESDKGGLTAINPLSFLLNQPKLSDFDDETLTKLLNDSLDVLKSIKKNDISTLQEILSSEFVRESPAVTADGAEESNNNITDDENENKNCPSPPPSDIARVSDLLEVAEEYGERIADDINYFSESLSESQEDLLNDEVIVNAFRKSIDTKLPNAIQTQLDQALTIPQELLTNHQAATSQQQQGVCLQEMDLIAMVNLALKDPSKLEENLRAVVREMDRTANIIFDADLSYDPSSSSSEHNNNKSSRRRPPPVNLRQVLDNEWFLDGSTKFLDSIVDLTSGYNDMFDTAIDDIAGSGDASVGRVLVSKLLHLTGKIPLPNTIQQMYN